MYGRSVSSACGACMGVRSSGVSSGGVVPSPDTVMVVLISATLVPVSTIAFKV